MFYADLFISIWYAFSKRTSRMACWKIYKQTADIQHAQLARAQQQWPPEKEDEMPQQFPLLAPSWLPIFLHCARFDMELGRRSFAHLAQIAVFFGECTTTNGPPPVRTHLILSPWGYANRERAPGLIKVSKRKPLRVFPLQLGVATSGGF